MNTFKKIFDFLTKDKDGTPSITRVAFFSGFMVVNAKLLISGLTISGLKMAAFSGTEYGVAIGALGSIYILRRNQPPK